MRPSVLIQRTQQCNWPAGCDAAIKQLGPDAGRKQPSVRQSCRQTAAAVVHRAGGGGGGARTPRRGGGGGGAKSKTKRKQKRKRKARASRDGRERLRGGDARVFSLRLPSVNATPATWQPSNGVCLARAFRQGAELIVMLTGREVGTSRDDTSARGACGAAPGSSSYHPRPLPPPKRRVRSAGGCLARHD